MWPDRVSNSGPMTYEPGALPIALRGPSQVGCNVKMYPITLDNCGSKLG